MVGWKSWGGWWGLVGALGGGTWADCVGCSAAHTLSELYWRGSPAGCVLAHGYVFLLPAARTIAAAVFLGWKPGAQLLIAGVNRCRGVKVVCVAGDGDCLAVGEVLNTWQRASACGQPGVACIPYAGLLVASVAVAGRLGLVWFGIPHQACRGAQAPLGQHARHPWRHHRRACTFLKQATRTDSPGVHCVLCLELD